jgi:hypothetical protein
MVQLFWLIQSGETLPLSTALTTIYYKDSKFFAAKTKGWLKLFLLVNYILFCNYPPLYSILVCRSICHSVCLSVRLSECLSVSLTFLSVNIGRACQQTRKTAVVNVKVFVHLDKFGTHERIVQ